MGTFVSKGKRKKSRSTLSEGSVPRSNTVSNIKQQPPQDDPKSSKALSTGSLSPPPVSEKEKDKEREKEKDKDKEKEKEDLEKEQSPLGQSQKEEKESKEEKKPTTPRKDPDPPKPDDNADEDDPVVYSRNSQKVTADDFELLTVIGKGSFGKVMQVRKKDDGGIYAMKVLRKEAIILKKQVVHTKAERSILERIQHPFIVKLHFAFQTDDKLYMVLDYINGGELFFHLKKEGRFPDVRVRQYVAEIVSALTHLHSLNIIYRDLKPENLLLDNDGHIVITDFGLSKEVSADGGTHTFCGTPEYIAPEMLKGQGHGKAVDWWSLGTLMFEMLTGLPPFYSQNVNVMYQKILNSELKCPPFISPEAKSLLEGLLNRNPAQRLGGGPDDGDEIKAHPYFKSIDWAKLDAKEIEPVFKPSVSSKTDTTQIDPVFTGEAVVDSLVERTLPLDVMKENNFENFTFQNDSELQQ